MGLYAFDGTWNTLKADDAAYRNTNVVRFHQAYEHGSGATQFYVEGVGTRFDLVGHILGGVFGLGELPRLNEAYDALCVKWLAGDRQIDIVGFSRGAATALDFCNLLLKRGIRKPGTDVVVERAPRIHFLGVWDIVAAFGIANLGATDLNLGHHLDLPRRSVRYAFHALALDERRPSFLPTRIQGACEVWFRGVHSDIGGGNGNRGLNDISLKWMMHKALAAGLPIDPAALTALAPDPAARPHPAVPLTLDVRLVSDVDRRHHTVAPCAGYRNPAPTCPIEGPQDELVAVEVGPGGIEVLPAALRDRAMVLRSVAEAEAHALDMPIDGVREGLLGLIEARIPLVTDDASLLRARDATIRLVRQMVVAARHHGYHALNEFFLTEALFTLRPLYPFTDA